MMMNTTMNALFFMLAGSIYLLTASCKKNDAAPLTPATVNSTITSGTWKVTYFKDDTEDETSDFAGYVFTFNSNGAVSATKPGNTESGTWSAGNDDSKVKFIIFFSAPDPFEEISEDWRVTERTDTKIKLEHLSGGDGHIDYLNFEKN